MDFDMKNECDGCIHKDDCGIDAFFWDEIDVSDEERFMTHCVGCCCGDGHECNKNKSHKCSNYEAEALLG